MALAARLRRRPRRDCAGVSLVEFAMVSPVLFLLVMGIAVGGVVVTNQLQLSSVVREGARAAAVCGGIGRSPAQLLPDGGTCSNGALVSFIAGSLHSVPGTVALNITVINGNSIPNDPNVLDECQKGKTVVVDASFAQPLYVPLLGNLLGDSGGLLVRTLHASAEATCEQ